MRRRLLDLCLFAYPHARRTRDRDYLRDLALELAETHGFARQALSLLLGGLTDRIESRRRGGRARVGTWLKRTVVASFVVAATTLVANGLIGTVGSDGERVHEIEQFVCVSQITSSTRDALGINRAGRCAETPRLIADREGPGWDCTTRRRTHNGRRSITAQCTRETSVALPR